MGRIGTCGGDQNRVLAHPEAAVGADARSAVARLGTSRPRRPRRVRAVALSSPKLYEAR